MKMEQRSATSTSAFVTTFLLRAGAVACLLCTHFVLSQRNGLNSNQNQDNCLRVPSCTSFFANKFRSLDGSCNNVARPWLGAVNRPYRKMMPAEYTRFGSLDLPRGGKGPSMLPPPRSIRLEVHPDVNQPDERLSTVMMTFGQFVGHTMMLTSTEQLSEPSNTCCTPTSKSDSCFPIQIPATDRFFSQHSVSCRNFKRSPQYCPSNQQPGRQRLQTNLLSSYLDLSTVYGSDFSTSNRLRFFSRGLMKMSRNSLLPDSSSNQAAFDAGDSRVNQNPMLTAMHIVWLREHNRIATELSSVHLDWNDERLFQETRRITIAEFQNVVYNEYIQLLFNSQTYFQWHLNSTWYSSYGADIDPTVTAEVAAAAFRMGHSMINGDQALISNGIPQRTYKISEFFFRPKELLRSSADVDMMIEGMATIPNQKVDRFITDEIANQFGKSVGAAFGSDLISTNIQRGRDHGIPSYNSVRRFCRLRPINFDSLAAPELSSGAFEAMKRVYRTADQVDLFTGGLAETPLRSSALGPTFTCILSAEFYRKKYGDRYFFTHARQSGSFTPPQLQNIVRRRLFDIFCDNTRIQWLAPSVLQQPIGGNIPVSCSTKRGLNLNLF